MICVDLGPQAQDKAGDPVILWGEGLPVERIAEMTKVSAYELITRLTSKGRDEIRGLIPVSEGGTMSYSEIAACLAYAVSVWLAARNNVHTWWIGIIGSMLYGWVLVRATLCRCHAPVILHRDQHHRLIHWLKGQGGDVLPVRRTQASHFSSCCSIAVVVAGGYGFCSTPYQCPGPGWIL